MKVVKEEEEEEGDLCDGCEGGIYALRGRGGGTWNTPERDEDYKV